MLGQWRHEGVLCKQMPTDPLALRVSVGGVPGMAYCTFRGDHARVVALLEQALEALKQGHNGHSDGADDPG